MIGKIEFHRSFKKRYRVVPLKIQQKFDEQLLLFENDPHHPLLNMHPLTGDRMGQWSINITGDWRAIYIFKDEKSVVFIDLNTHSNLYK
ncbi:MAG: hypothetical protein A3G05_02055 [Candidatus Zambryskibacteria bacterium RIFCSPLOWO2_12_FULL_45_14]|uniref:Uncharacterized protein n=2 Tax=Candidatus Zambryskiibacteriota TaxID=1817925 RepID=A0A1G2UML8_9BACT|nr:MAG: hypothetical protein A3H60_01000 [Candidatus Zambryskibacteria bacterium RIFCSPLOWO2_02_FULL_44_12b]OHB14199.1 MAG: hypothetical protein A3G05_02055 [Candidatus Zambryskibacteria bacterium RIFCSPLOWO2_12_FULL_45_14]